MSTAIEKQEPVNRSSLRRLVARHPATAFLVMAFGFGWTSLIPILLSENGFGVLPLELPLTVVQTLATVLGLALPAFLVTAATGGKDGVRDLLRRLLRWRVGIHWYLIALFGLFVAVLLAAIPFLGLAPLQALAQKWGLLFTVFLPGVILPFLHTNLWEELGWAGFLQSALQDRRGPLLASVMVAPVFTLFHLPAYFVAGWIVDEHTPLSQLPNVLLDYVVVVSVFAIFFRVLVIWLYNVTGRSVLMAGLFHAAFNMVSGQKIMPELVPNLDSGLLATAVVAVLALVGAVFTRGHLGYKPERAAPQPAETAGVRPDRGCGNQHLRIAVRF
jgi:membrane protease YdiL (CAAX protease family)